MKVLALFFFSVLTYTEVAFACPDFSGQYRFTDASWNGTIRIEQQDCSKVTIIQTRTGRTMVQNLRTNGRAYVGIENSSQRARSDASWFQKVSFENGHLVIRQYSGPTKKCGTHYSTSQGDCHLVVISLKHLGTGDRYEWAQTGVWWTEGNAAITDRYSLRKASSMSISSVAQN